MPDPRLADRLAVVAPSRTQQVTTIVHRLRGEGADIIDLGAGEPDAPTPDHIMAAAVAALDDNFTRYTVGAGVIALREAIGEHYHARYGVRFGPEQIVVTSGGKQGHINVSKALIGTGLSLIHI